ncbi:hypothetical protein GGTG_09281 [Gaeumannomyces tritici R3-111a-1]|uniref:Uncharacterized protein n=1 Tax=Gaeumannomyces tritici (strain R3-111a-1) TaxID=644352 RepID=J3P6Y5_GAET3|nr:hypothetical protein GGTG_09281 [Gaeumannomyces tritici R3-111a-1]EJT72415.1 hypothetical protein GGTG_09281 [Gaeumannomyces tritici R3-111a-1]
MTFQGPLRNPSHQNLTYKSIGYRHRRRSGPGGSLLLSSSPPLPTPTLSCSEGLGPGAAPVVLYRILVRGQGRGTFQLGSLLRNGRLEAQPG